MIGALKSVFVRHGVPEEVLSDNGPQIVSEEMKEFAYTVWISHITHMVMVMQSVLLRLYTLMLHTTNIIPPVPQH